MPKRSSVLVLILVSLVILAGVLFGLRALGGCVRPAGALSSTGC